MSSRSRNDAIDVDCVSEEDDRVTSTPATKTPPRQARKRTADAANLAPDHEREVRERQKMLARRSESPERKPRSTEQTSASRKEKDDLRAMQENDRIRRSEQQRSVRDFERQEEQRKRKMEEEADVADDGKFAVGKSKIEQQLERARAMKEKALKEMAKGDPSKIKRRLGARSRESKAMRSTVHWSDKGLSDMHERDWKILREDFEIQVLGGGSICPHPIRSWDEGEAAGILPPEIMRAIRDAGYKHPSPVQMACIPIGARRVDLVGLAETGSGKTCAFVVPMVMYVAAQPRMTPEMREDGPFAAIMCPTRELAWQIEEECVRFCDPYGFRTVSIVGGVSPEEQAQEIRRGAEVVVGTPGRICDLLDKKYLVFSQCNYVVLDEADSMIKEKMQEQVIQIFEHMPSSNEKPVEELDEDAAKVYRVTVMFSSTMAPELNEIAKRHLRRPVTVKIGLSSPSDIRQTVVVVESAQRQSRFLASLREVLEVTTDPLVLVFMNARHEVENLSYTLSEEGISCDFMHGGLTQNQRSDVVNTFSERKIKVLVSTDIMGRGIHIKGITHVMNYDMPQGESPIDKYSQRIGRTGRQGVKGDAISFVLPTVDNGIMYDLVKKLEADGQTVPTELRKQEAARVDPKVQEMRGKRDTVIRAQGVR